MNRALQTPARASPSRGRSYCSVNGCFNTSESKPNISYFKHPADVERRIQWLELIGREELIEKSWKNYCVCEDHFRVQDILKGNKRKTLKKTALPSLLLPFKRWKKSNTAPSLLINSQLKSEETLMDMETSVKIEECEDPLNVLDEPPEKATRIIKTALPTPGCSKKVVDTQNSNFVFLGQDTFQKLSNKFLPKELSDLVKAHSNLKKLAGTTYLDMKLINLNFYHSNPQAYRMLQDALGLPCTSTIHKNVIPISNEINGTFLSLLETKVSIMTNMEKNCSAAISTISLKPNLFYNIRNDVIIGYQEINGVRISELAEKAYIMMVRGIYSNWKQPVGYALLSRGENSVEFNEWIDGMLEKLTDIGLKVRTFVSDTGDEFMNAAINRNVTIENPYFFIKNRKIYYIFDVPHLIKLVRNFFIQYDFQYQDRIAKYEHVRDFYNNDKNKEFKLAPKLTKSHIYPTNFEKMNLHYATQLLSNSVATGIATYVDFQFINKSGKNTADFIKLMNNLFDSLNSLNLKDTDEYKSVFRGQKTQIDIFNEMLIFFQNLNLCNANIEVKFIKGFQTTITSILQLFDDLKSEGYTYLPTRRLNMEVVDDLLDQIKTKRGKASEPTSWQFVSCYRKCLLSNFMKTQERKTSADDLATWLIQIQSNRFRRAVSDAKARSNQIKDLNDEAGSFFKIRTTDYDKYEFQEKHRLFEVSHYLLGKCAEKHDCKLFKSYIKPYKNIPNFIEESRYRNYREYSTDQCKSLLVVPCDNFVLFVKKMDARFVPIFKMSNYCANIAELLYASIIDEPYICPPCLCFPKTYLVKQFIRMNMYNIIKLNNKAFSLSKSNIGKLIVNRL